MREVDAWTADRHRQVKTKKQTDGQPGGQTETNSDRGRLMEADRHKVRPRN